MSPIKEAIEALEKLIDYSTGQLCLHEDTYRGGVLWEICRTCGAKWADDEGGRPEWTEPKQIVEARAALAALRSMPAEPVFEIGFGWLSSERLPNGTLLYTTPPPAPVLSDAWQPIETAPKDRTEILACWPKRKLDDDDCPTGEIVGYAQCVTAWQGFWIEPDYLEAHGSYYMEDEAFAAEPTHWQPLPPPPPIEQAIGRASRGAK